MRYARILAAVVGTPWAIEPNKGRAVASFFARAVLGETMPAEEARRLNPRREEKVRETRGAVAVIPLMGIMTQHAALVQNVSDPAEASTDEVGRMVSAAAADPDIKAIILRVESPGGSVYGVQELAERIFQARSSKPVIAQVDSYAASAAYWAASQATEIVVSPGGDVGSIGVYALHQDISQFLEAEGVNPTFVYAGKYKVEGNPFEPLGDEARSHLQGRVDAAYGDFLAAVGRGRGRTPESVEKSFGQGRMVKDTEALDRGMADRIATFEETLNRFVGQPSSDHSRRRARLALAEQI